MLLGLLAFVAFFAVCGGLSALIIGADKRDQAAYDRWECGFMESIRRR